MKRNTRMPTYGQMPYKAMIAKAKESKYNEGDYWEFRCRMREEMDDPTIIPEDRQRAGMLYHILMHKS